jgi:hypothetical protein
MKLKNYIPYALLLSLHLQADQFSFIFYNDFFAGTDEHFTNDMSLSWLDDEKYFNHYYGGISINQMIFTPANTTTKEAQYDDMPYSGYLCISTYLFDINEDENSFIEYRIEAGLTGKYAYAKEVQNNFHTLIHNSKAQGWDTQLSTYYTFNTLIRYGETTYHKKLPYAMKMDWFNHIGFQAGNFVDNIFWGSTLRIGKNYKKNFNLHYPYLKEQASQLALQKPHKGFGYSLSLGVNADYLFYALLFDKADKEGYKIKKYHLNGFLYMGYDFYYDRHKFTFFYQKQSPYTNDHNEMNSLGGILYNYQY